MARFFIYRPVFAWVLALIVMLVGVFGLESLPISQYPEIAPTTVRISATYTGASAEIVENSVTTVIEDGLTGIDGLLYMESTSAAGQANITLTFDDSVVPDMAQVDVQNKLQLVQSNLPDAVQAAGVSVTRSTSSMLMIGALVSDDGSYSSLKLGDIFSRTLKDPLTRTSGVGSVHSFGSEYSMRVWLDPTALYKYQLTANDVTDAVSNQNTNVTVGSLGSQPTSKGQQFTISLSAQSQMSTIAQFERILLKTNEDGSSVYLGDVAKIELGAKSYGSTSRFNGKPAAGFGINLATGANAVDTSAAVNATVKSLSSALPTGVHVVYPYDTTPFVQESIHQVYHTLIEAIILVFIVILIFLQNWRATLIPTIAVPIVLLGTFGVLTLFDMSINTLTMFALVLAIGLLVDDAIVVVENVERIMREEGLDPMEATLKSMREISGALVGIVLVLSAVFLPMAFMGGSTGIIYRQFSVTIISAMVLSLFVALILTPTMCAHLLRPPSDKKKFILARGFNTGLQGLTNKYGGLVGFLMRKPFRMLLVLAVVIIALIHVYKILPTSFLPVEDQGCLMGMVQLPDDATLQQTTDAVAKVEKYLLNDQKDAVDVVFSALGFSFNSTDQNSAMLFVKLKDYGDRPEKDATTLVQQINGHFMGNRYGMIVFMQPPAVHGLGESSGFTMYLIDQMGHGIDALVKAADTLVGEAQKTGKITGLRGNDNPKETSMQLTIDQQKAGAFDLTLSEINSMLSTIFAGNYVNDFTLGDKLREVIVQGDADHRMQPEHIDNWYMRNSDGDMVPFSAFINKSWKSISNQLVKYGGTRAMELSGSAIKGVSSGDAMTIMSDLVKKLPGSYGIAWTGISYQERLSGNQEPLLYSLSVIVIFLCLAALYESWAVPFSVMLAIPVGILGALLAAKVFGQSNDVYFKVGLLTTIGLAARNAILVVEFAETLQKRGMDVIQATAMSARQRLRPILMTTFAFMMGILPLAVASGAGAGAQKSIGIGMLGGIAFAVVFGTVMVPVFYIVVMKLVRMVRRGGKTS